MAQLTLGNARFKPSSSPLSAASRLPSHKPSPSLPPAAAAISSSSSGSEGLSLAQTVSALARIRRAHGGHLPQRGSVTSTSTNLMKYPFSKNDHPFHLEHFYSLYTLAGFGPIENPPEMDNIFAQHMQDLGAGEQDQQEAALRAAAEAASEEAHSTDQLQGNSPDGDHSLFADGDSLHADDPLAVEARKQADSLGEVDNAEGAAENDDSQGGEKEQAAAEPRDPCDYTDEELKAMAAIFPNGAISLPLQRCMLYNPGFAPIRDEGEQPNPPPTMIPIYGIMCYTYEMEYMNGLESWQNFSLHDLDSQNKFRSFSFFLAALHNAKLGSKTPEDPESFYFRPGGPGTAIVLPKFLPYVEKLVKRMRNDMLPEEVHAPDNCAGIRIWILILDPQFRAGTCITTRIMRNLLKNKMIKPEDYERYFKSMRNVHAQEGDMTHLLRGLRDAAEQSSRSEGFEFFERAEVTGRTFRVSQNSGPGNEDGEDGDDDDDDQRNRNNKKKFATRWTERQIAEKKRRKSMINDSKIERPEDYVWTIRSLKDLVRYVYGIYVGTQNLVPEDQLINTFISLNRPRSKLNPLNVFTFNNSVRILKNKEGITKTCEINPEQALFYSYVDENSSLFHCPWPTLMWRLKPEDMKWTRLRKFLFPWSHQSPLEDLITKLERDLEKRNFDLMRNSHQFNGSVSENSTVLDRMPEHIKTMFLGTTTSIRPNYNLAPYINGVFAEDAQANIRGGLRNMLEKAKEEMGATVMDSVVAKMGRTMQALSARVDRLIEEFPEKAKRLSDLRYLHGAMIYENLYKGVRPDTCRGMKAHINYLAERLQADPAIWYDFPDLYRNLTPSANIMVREYNLLEATGLGYNLHDAVVFILTEVAPDSYNENSPGACHTLLISHHAAGKSVALDTAALGMPESSYDTVAHSSSQTHYVEEVQDDLIKFTHEAPQIIVGSHGNFSSADHQQANLQKQILSERRATWNALVWVKEHVESESERRRQNKNVSARLVFVQGTNTCNTGSEGSMLSRFFLYWLILPARIDRSMSEQAQIASNADPNIIHLWQTYQRDMLTLTHRAFKAAHLRAMPRPNVGYFNLGLNLAIQALKQYNFIPFDTLARAITRGISLATARLVRTGVSYNFVGPQSQILEWNLKKGTINGQIHFTESLVPELLKYDMCDSADLFPPAMARTLCGMISPQVMLLLQIGGRICGYADEFYDQLYQDAEERGYFVMPSAERIAKQRETPDSVLQELYLTDKVEYFEEIEDRHNKGLPRFVIEWRRILRYVTARYMGTKKAIFLPMKSSKKSGQAVFEDNTEGGDPKKNNRQKSANDDQGTIPTMAPGAAAAAAAAPITDVQRNQQQISELYKKEQSAKASDTNGAPLSSEGTGNTQQHNNGNLDPMYVEYHGSMDDLANDICVELNGLPVPFPTEPLQVKNALEHLSRISVSAPVIEPISSHCEQLRWEKAAGRNAPQKGRRALRWVRRRILKASAERRMDSETGTSSWSNHRVLLLVHALRTDFMAMMFEALTVHECATTRRETVVLPMTLMGLPFLPCPFRIKPKPGVTITPPKHHALIEHLVDKLIDKASNRNYEARERSGERFEKSEDDLYEDEIVALGKEIAEKIISQDHASQAMQMHSDSLAPDASEEEHEVAESEWAHETAETDLPIASESAVEDSGTFDPSEMPPPSQPSASAADVSFQKNGSRSSSQLKYGLPGQSPMDVMMYKAWVHKSFRVEPNDAEWYSKNLIHVPGERKKLSDWTIRNFAQYKKYQNPHAPPGSTEVEKDQRPHYPSDLLKETRANMQLKSDSETALDFIVPNSQEDESNQQLMREFSDKLNQIRSKYADGALAKTKKGRSDPSLQKANTQVPHKPSSTPVPTSKSHEANSGAEASNVKLASATKVPNSDKHPAFATLTGGDESNSSFQSGMRTPSENSDSESSALKLPPKNNSNNNLKEMFKRKIAEGLPPTGAAFVESIPKKQRSNASVPPRTLTLSGETSLGGSGSDSGISHSSADASNAGGHDTDFPPLPRSNTRSNPPHSVNKKMSYAPPITKKFNKPVPVSYAGSAGGLTLGSKKFPIKSRSFKN